MEGSLEQMLAQEVGLTLISDVRYPAEEDVNNFAADSLMDHSDDNGDSLDYITGASAPVEDRYL